MAAKMHFILILRKVSPSAAGSLWCASDLDQSKSYRGGLKEINDRLEFDGGSDEKVSAFIDEPEPKKALGADRPPTEGFVVIVDDHFKSEFDTMAAA